MSFSASATRVRDPTRSLGLRVMCLYECLDCFSVFGFNATRDRLRVMTGSTGDERWSDDSVVVALDHLTRARRSWLDFAAADATQRRADKRAGRPRSRTTSRGVRLAWVAAYLDGPARAEWAVVGLGACGDCGHRLVHHGAHGCFACRDVTGRDVRSWCRAPLPPALGPGRT